MRKRVDEFEKVLREDKTGQCPAEGNSSTGGPPISPSRVGASTGGPGASKTEKGSLAGMRQPARKLCHDHAKAMLLHDVPMLAGRALAKKISVLGARACMQ